MPRPTRWPVPRVVAADSIDGAAAPIASGGANPRGQSGRRRARRGPLAGLDRAPAQPAAADLDLDIAKSHRAQAIRQSFRRDGVAGVAEMQNPESQRRHAVAAGKDTTATKHAECLGE